MLNLTDKQILEIADTLEAGMKCYYNIKTGKIKEIPDFDTWTEIDDEVWEKDLNEIDEHPDDYLEFEGLITNESFQAMADFAESITDIKLQKKLFNALNKPKPFQNFRGQIDISGDFRTQWFDFRRMRFIEKVKKQIEMYNQRLDE
ncbi:MAG: UPF0158 family protein [Ignavibacteriaceae bacterium]|nr:UPF0158 family protein [Ignavibacteriaceae bacterium]